MSPSVAMDYSDHSVRMAAFRYLEEQTQLAGEDGALRERSSSAASPTRGNGFRFSAQGIFKPRVLLRDTTREHYHGARRGGRIAAH